MKTHIIIATLLLIAFGALAQTNLPPDITATDEGIRDAVAKFSYWKLLIVPLTVVLCAGIKHLIGFIPNKYIPWIGPILGGALDLLASKFGFWTGNGDAGLMMGGLATWAHQAFTQPLPPKTIEETKP